MYRGGYQAVERWCRPLVVMLGAALACTAAMARPNPAAIIQGFLHPSLGSSSGSLSAAFVMMALTGAAAGALSNLKYQAFLHEKGWRHIEILRVQRIDLATAALGLLIMGALVQSAAAEALASGKDLVHNPSELISAFGAALGPMGSIVVALGLWAAVFGTYVASNTGYSLIAVDIIGHLSDRNETASAGQRPAYSWVLLFFVVSPVYALWTDWSPVWLALAVSALEAALMPISASLLLLLTMGRSRMGLLRNSMATNAALALVIIAALALIARNVWEWL
jgi:Mn2+/Fe2+ NRAMP family transporter